jgi:hypothetical protein
MISKKDIQAGSIVWIRVGCYNYYGLAVVDQLRNHIYKNYIPVKLCGKINCDSGEYSYMHILLSSIKKVIKK